MLYTLYNFRKEGKVICCISNTVVIFFHDDKSEGDGGEMVPFCNIPNFNIPKPATCKKVKNISARSVWVLTEEMRNFMDTRNPSICFGSSFHSFTF